MPPRATLFSSEVRISDTTNVSNILPATAEFFSASAVSHLVTLKEEIKMENHRSDCLLTLKGKLENGIYENEPTRGTERKRCWDHHLRIKGKI